MNAAMKNKDRFAKRLAHLGMIGMAAMVLAGCGGGGSESGTELNVTGKWTGEWISTADNTTAKGTITATVVQEGNAISGNAAIKSTGGCFATDGPALNGGIANMLVAATLDRQAIGGQVTGATTAEDKIEYNLVVNGNTATGTYRILSSSATNEGLHDMCIKGRGNVTLQRVQ